MSEILSRFANLSPEQRKLLLKKMQERGLAPQQSRTEPETAPLVRVARDKELPLSFAQQRLWFIDQWEAGSVAYNIFSAVRLAGRLDLAALERSLNEVVRRHEVLRTTFTAVMGRPAQIIAAALRLALPLLDLSGVPEGEREAQAHLLAAQEARWSFELARGPLLRCSLLRLDAETHMLLVNMHHIISDGWSTGVFIQEMATLYPAFSAGRPSPLAALPLQYADFAAWQRGWLQGELLEQQLSYWTRQLRDAPAVLDLPTDHPRPAVPTFRGAMQTFRLPAPLTEALRALGRTEKSTLFMTILAAFDVLLQRYSGQADILVGTPIANRRWMELEGLIGFFVNTLVVRSDLSGIPTFRELLRRVREVMLGAYAHQDMPFELLVSELGVARDLSRAPLFQVMFILQNTPLKRLKLPALTLAPLAVDAGTAMFDLALAMTEVDDFVYGEFQYDTDLFEASTIARMTGHFQTLLERIVAEPARQLWQLPLLTAAERQQLLVEWNSTQRVYAHASSIQEMFEAQVERAPQAVAVVFDRPTTNDHRPSTIDRSPLHPFTPSPLQSLTYDELNARANRLAHHLRALGVGPEVRVGTCMERSVEVLIAVLGILKAGGAYVPLDPAYPQERLAFMLEDAQVAVLLTTTDHRPPTTDHRPTTNDQRPTSTPSPLHPVTPSGSVVDLRADWPAIAQAPPLAPISGAAAENLAYVIYTSGSTGAPKGVAISHRSLANYTAAAQDNYMLGSNDRVLQFASLSFDTSAEEIYPCLISGATLVLRTDAMLSSAGTFLRTCREWALTVLDLPTAYWHLVVASMAEDVLPFPSTVRMVVIGGEQALPERLSIWKEHVGPQVRLVNTYGPTEATIATTMAELAPRNAERQADKVSIGRAIPNAQVYVLDRYLQPTPIGVPGELCIGGRGLARGYLQRPDLTAEKFIPNPFAGVTGDGWWVMGAESSNTQHPTPNTRLYKTGDLARYRPNGEIEFLGRTDHQVKLRGYRIELGEIETVLAQHPSVRDCVVLAQADGSGDKRLVAYVVQGSGVRGQDILHSAFCILHSDELRTFLKQKLPEYMLPSAFVLLETLPLTPNGKVDRKALPAPEAGASVDGREYLAPRTPTEELLAGIWALVLGRERVGVSDNFFALGGHSLLATQVASRIRATLGVELPLREIFEAPMLAQLAARIQATDQDAQGAALPPIVPAPRDRPPPLSFAQERLWFLNRLEPGSTAYNIPMAVRMTGRLDTAALEQSFGRLVERHETLRTTIAIVEDQPVQLIHPPAPVTIPIVELQALEQQQQEEEIRRLIDAESSHVFDLQRGPLMRISLLRVTDADYILIFNLHHIITDGWSMSVLIDELTALYVATATGQPITLTTPEIQYADFTLWQRAWLEGTGDTGQGATAPLPPPAGGGTEGGESQGSDVGEGQTQNSKLKTQNSPLEVQLAYWKEQLAGLATLEFPTDRPRPPFQTSNGATQPITLPPDLSKALALLSRREGTTLFMTLLAAFQALLARYSGQTDIAVGTVIAGRNHAAIERIVGFFVNTLVLRADLNGNPSFRQLLRRVREMTLGAYAHQDLPFERLVEELQPERDLSRSPLFQVLFELQNLSPSTATLSDVDFTALPVEAGTAKFDLTLTLQESDEGLLGAFEYNTDLFEPATVRRLIGHLQTLLEGVVADPARRLADLALLNVAERQQLLVDWNATARPYALDHSFMARFAEQVARTPAAVAVVFVGPGDKQTRRQADQACPEWERGETGVDKGQTQNSTLNTQNFSPNTQHPTPNTQQLTYQQLFTRTARLAAVLNVRGVARGAVVPLLAERGLDFLSAVLALFAGGGAYLPLDPHHPPQRLRQVLHQSRCDWLLATRACAAPLVAALEGDHAAPRVLWFEELVSEASSDLLAGPAPGDPRDLAYVLFTSGSTGTPKGVLIEQAGMLNHLLLMVEQLGLSGADTVAQSASQSFDISVWQLLTALLVGGRVAVLDDMTMRDPEAILAAVAQFDITVLQVVPSLLGGLLDVLGDSAARDDSLARLRWLIPTGEALPPTLARHWLARYPHIPLLNAYGPAECSDDVTLGRITTAPSGDTASTSIGRPVANMQVYVLDRHGVPVPLGVTGELYIGGVGVGRGYLNDPKRTAECFVPNPFAGVLGDGCRVSGGESSNTQHPSPNTRLYRTGDLARYRGDGSLEFLGRIDHQVKIRGFRIELGEIEAALGRHAGVRDVVVVVREDMPGQKRLVAYVVPKIEDRRLKIEDSNLGSSERLSSIFYPLSSELRAFLKQRLPDYMIPSAFMLLDALPLTPNGKVDRRALPRPEQDRPAPRETLTAPRDAVELYLVQIWEDLLGVHPIGIADNFFDLGGHSLLAVRLMARIEQRFGYSLPLSRIFQGATIQQLAQHMRERTDALHDSALIAIRTTGSKPPFFCVHPIAGTAVCYYDLAEQLGPDQPFYGLEARGLHDEDALESSIEEMASDYIAAVRAVQQEGPYLIGGWSFGGAVALEMAQQLQQQGREVAMLALFDSWAPIANISPDEQDDAALLRLFIEGVGAIPRKDIRTLPDRIPHYIPDDPLRYIVEQAGDEGIFPLGADYTYAQRLFEVYKSNYRALSRYQTQPYAIPTFLFRAREEAAQNPHDITLGWDQLSATPVEVRTVPGDHYSMLTRPHVQHLAEQLKACFESNQLQWQEAAASGRRSAAPAGRAIF